MVDQILPLLLESERFLLTTHIKPDGDAVGSQLALGLFLRNVGKQVAMINSDPPPDNLSWMPGVDLIQSFNNSVSQLEQINGADVVVVLDTNALNRLGRMANPVKNSSGVKLLIDHHTEPESWFDGVYVRDTASSTGELVYEILSHYDVELIDHDIATALYAAILTDTGSFRYSSVTPAVHRIVADLMERGELEPDVIYTALYETRTPHGLRLLGLVLDTLTLRYQGQLSYLVVSKRMLEEAGATYDDTDGFVNYALSVEGVRVALLFTETPGGTKVSFRSKGDLYVNDWARAFGGGGHRNASGAYVTRPLDHVIEEVVASAPRYLPLQETPDASSDTLSAEDSDYLSTLLDLKAQKSS